MEQFKRAKVIMLPTKEAMLNGLYLKPKLNQFNKTALENHNNGIYNCKPQHLYIISDDEIKKGDWVVNENNNIFQYTGGLLLPTDKKIIATTDTNINLDVFDKKTCKGDKDCSKHCDCLTLKHKGLPQPSQQFIEKYIEYYNRGKVITDILVEYDLDVNNSYVCYGDCGICDDSCKIIYKPKINPKDNTITIKKLKDSWNREEVIELIKRFNSESAGNVWFDTDENWIEQNL